MKHQHPLYAKVQEWLETENEPSEAQLAELEKSFQDFTKQTIDEQPLPWDWELLSFEGEPQENADEWYSDQEIEDEYLDDLY